MMKIKLAIICLGIVLMGSAIAATVTVRVGVEFVDPIKWAQLELGEQIIHSYETNSPYCEIDERGVVCQ